MSYLERRLAVAQCPGHRAGAASHQGPKQVPRPAVAERPPAPGGRCGPASGSLVLLEVARCGPELPHPLGEGSRDLEEWTPELVADPLAHTGAG